MPRGRERVPSSKLAGQALATDKMMTRWARSSPTSHCVSEAVQVGDADRHAAEIGLDPIRGRNSSIGRQHCRGQNAALQRLRRAIWLTT